MAADIKALNNYRTSVYVVNMDHVFYSNTTAGNRTESERVYLPPGQFKINVDAKGFRTGEVSLSGGGIVLEPGYVSYD